MKRCLYLLLVIIFALGVAIPSFAQAPSAISVVCNGTESGGNGLRLYQYEVSLAANRTIERFAVGTCCGDKSHYADWILPAGWAWDLLPDSDFQHDPKTAHGEPSVSHAPECNWYLYFDGPAINAGTFAYNNPHRSHDVGWSTSGDVSVTADWSKPVGTGEGPIHAPVPEPGSFLALGSGLIGLAGTLIRRRR